MFGADANWGRVLCAIGYSGAEVDVNKVDVSFRSAGGHRGSVQGRRRAWPSPRSRPRQVLLEKEIGIHVDLAPAAAARPVAWGCDLTYDYVKINGDYRT